MTKEIIQWAVLLAPLPPLIAAVVAIISPTTMTSLNRRVIRYFGGADSLPTWFDNPILGRIAATVVALACLAIFVQMFRDFNG